MPRHHKAVAGLARNATRNYRVADALRFHNDQMSRDVDIEFAALGNPRGEPGVEKY